MHHIFTMASKFKTINYQNPKHFLELLLNEMKLPWEQHLFQKKWAAYRNEGYQESYREETREKEMKEELFTAKTVMIRAGTLWEKIIQFLERVYVGTYML